MRVRSFTRKAIPAADREAMAGIALEGHIIVFEPWPGMFQVHFNAVGLPPVRGTGRTVADALASIERQIAA